MIQRAFANCGIRIAQRTEFIFLILKDIGIDRAWLHAVFFRESLNIGTWDIPFGISH